MKQSLTVLVITAVLAVFSAAPLAAQPAADQDANPYRSQLKESIAQSELLAAQRSSTVDVKAMNKAVRQTAPQKSWIDKHRFAFFTIVVVGIAAIVFVGLKYGKECLRSDPANCTPGVDDPCTCLEYKQNK